VVFHDPKTWCGSLEIPDLKESRAWRSISDPLPMDCAAVLDDNKRRWVRRMRVPRGEIEREVPTWAISNVLHLAQLPSLYVPPKVDSVLTCL
jgi:hypothetical protein